MNVSGLLFVSYFLGCLKGQNFGIRELDLNFLVIARNTGIFSKFTCWEI